MLDGPDKNAPSAGANLIIPVGYMLFYLRQLTDGCCKRRRVVNLACASIPAAYLQKDLKLVLDLGKIGNIAEVSLDNMNLGTTWMRGQQLEVTRAVKDGENKLAILVPTP